MCGVVSTVTSKQGDVGLNPAFLCQVCMFSLCLHVFPVSPTAISPTTQPTQVMLIGDSKLPVGVNVSVNGCLFLCISPAMNW